MDERCLSCYSLFLNFILNQSLLEHSHYAVTISVLVLPGLRLPPFHGIFPVIPLCAAEQGAVGRNETRWLSRTAMYTLPAESGVRWSFIRYALSDTDVAV